MFALGYYIVFKSTNKVNLYHEVIMPISVCPSTDDLYVQMQFPKHVLVKTREINHELKFLRSMSCSLFHTWGHIRNYILRGG